MHRKRKRLLSCSFMYKINFRGLTCQNHDAVMRHAVMGETLD